MSRRSRSRTAAARAAAIAAVATGAAVVPAVAVVPATAVVPVVAEERRIAEEDEVLAGPRLSALQLRQQCLASHEGVEDDDIDLPVSGLVAKIDCTFCNEPVSFSEEHVVDLEGNSTHFLPSRLKLVYNFLVLSSGFAGLRTTLVWRLCIPSPILPTVASFTGRMSCCGPGLRVCTATPIYWRIKCVKFLSQNSIGVPIKSVHFPKFNWRVKRVN